MKRSEMIKLMWNFIQSVENDYDAYMGEDDTELLLDKMLEAGMLPPERLEEVADNDSGCVEEGSVLVCVNTWDKE